MHGSLWEPAGHALEAVSVLSLKVSVNQALDPYTIITGGLTGNGSLMFASHSASLHLVCCLTTSLQSPH